MASKNPIILAWGAGEDGQLGIGNSDEKEWVCSIKALESEKVVSVVGGSRNSLAICEDGKIRYVQDYSLEKLVSRGARKHSEDIESGFSSDFESKYKKIYEDDINPFAAFSRKEKDQRYKELGFRDKITLSSGRFLLGNNDCGSEEMNR